MSAIIFVGLGKLMGYVGGEIGYGVSDLLDTAYRTSSVRRIELIRYGILSSSCTMYWGPWYGVLSFLDVDTAYSSKSGNGLEFFKVLDTSYRILGQYTQHGLKMDESTSVSSIIDKLPPPWKDFKHTLKHGKDGLSLVQLGSHLRIEESLRAQESDKGKGKKVGGPFVNITEEVGKTGHFKRDCRSGKKNNANAGGSGKGSKDHSQDQCQNLVPVWNSFVKYSVSLISKAFYVQVDAIAWWIDSGATTRIYKDRYWFKTFEPVEDGSVLYEGDEHFAHIYGKGSVALKFSFGKTVTLFNVLYVAKLHKNLVSGPVLNKYGYKQVCESDKHILSKSGVFVGFGYYNNGMFMLNVNKVPNDSDYVYMSSSIVVNSSLWHARLEHVHYKRMLEMSKYDLIPVVDERIIYETTAPYTPQQNGMAERKNRALMEMVNCMLSYSNLSEGFQGEAMLTACYLLNIVPNKRNKPIPYELWYKTRPNLTFLRVWGCRAIVRLSDPKQKTLGEKGIDCIFVGYVEHSKAYRLYVIEPDDYVFINSIIESRDAIFDENRFFSKPRLKDIIPNVQESQMDDHIDDVPSEIPEPQKEEDPRTYNEAMQSRDATFWKEAIDDKIGFIMENNTWGFRQKEGIDYFDTYAPVARITTIRLLLAIDDIHNLVIHQMDVKTAFLNGDLDEEVYMKQPKGFVMPGNEHKVCKLVKSLYGLKQAPKQWHQKFDEVSMKDMGEADVILGIKIKRENKGFVITQSHCIEKILKKFNRENCSPVSTPMDPVEKLMPNIGKLVDQLEYSRAIGCLMYAITSTRPDIAYVVGKLSRFTSNPSRQQWKEITGVFKYLRRTMNYGLSYVGYPSMLEAYSDASWINHVKDSSSTSGWVFLLGGGSILWASKKHELGKPTPWKEEEGKSFVHTVKFWFSVEETARKRGCQWCFLVNDAFWSTEKIVSLTVGMDPTIKLRREINVARLRFRDTSASFAAICFFRGYLFLPQRFVVLVSITDIKSVLTRKAFDIFFQKFHIPEDVHPQLPSPNHTIHEMHVGKIDPFLKSTEFSADDYAIFVAHLAPFQKFPEPFICLIGMSRNYTLDEDIYPTFLRDDGTDSSRHSSTHASEVEGDSIISSVVVPPVITEAVVTSYAINVPPVLMRTEYCLSGRKRLEFEYEKQADLLKVRDVETESLKAQLLLKETEAAKAIHLCAQVFTSEATEKMFQNDGLVGQEYLLALGAAIDRAIEKEMHDKLSAGIDHGKAGRSLEDVAAYNPSAEADYTSALQRLREVDFPLLSELKSHKDASTADVMDFTSLGSTVPPITIVDYEIMGTDGPEDAQGSSQGEVFSSPNKIEFEKKE
nr:hypothetical protein [Tanacetum cinerariifolium]